MEKKSGVKDMKTPAIIKTKANTPSSHVADIPRRETIRRNHLHLIPMKKGIPDNETSFEMLQMSFVQSLLSSNISTNITNDQPPASSAKVLSPKKVPESSKYSRYDRLIKKLHRLDF